MRIAPLWRAKCPTNEDVHNLNGLLRQSKERVEDLTFERIQDAQQCLVYTRSDPLTPYESARLGPLQQSSVRGVAVMRCGIIPPGRMYIDPVNARPAGTTIYHDIDEFHESHRLDISGNCSESMLAASHGLDNAIPSILSMIDFNNGQAADSQTVRNYLRHGKWPMHVTLDVDSEDVRKTTVEGAFIAGDRNTMLAHECKVRTALRFVMNSQRCQRRLRAWGASAAT